MGGLQGLLNASMEEIAKCRVFRKGWQKDLLLVETLRAL
jgi:hypothetical protein